MIQEIKRAELPVEAPEPASTWIQVTFTLDPEHYRALWRRAEAEHATVPNFIRESMIDYLGGIKSASRKRMPSANRNAGEVF